MIFFYEQDGTVNVHTIKDGQFVRTLIPIDCTGPSINITFIALSYQGNIILSVKKKTLIETNA